MTISLALTIPHGFNNTKYKGSGGASAAVRAAGLKAHEFDRESRDASEDLLTLSGLIWPLLL